MHYLWLFHSRNGARMHTCKGEDGDGETGMGGEGSLEIKAMENTHEWGLSLTRRRQCCWNNMHGEIANVWQQYMTVHGSHPSVKIVVLISPSKTCGSRRTITMHKLLSDMLMWSHVSLAKAVFLWLILWLLYEMINNFLIWEHFNSFFYILIMSKVQARRGHMCLKRRVDKVIRQCRLIGAILRLN